MVASNRLQQSAAISRRVLLGGLAVPATCALMRPFAGSASALEAPHSPIDGRKLVFEDNFQRFDTAIWNAGPKATTFDTGHYGRAAFSRAEGEEGFNPYAIVDDPSASDGKALEITAKYIGKPMNIYGYYGNKNPDYQWVSGNIQTARKDGTIIKGWREGYFEARMWCPEHPLTWPAFWLMNGRSILHPKTSLEIDIVEQKGWEKQLYGAYLHEWGKPNEHHEGTGVPVTVDLTAGYHDFGAAIKGDKCALYFDRKPVRDGKTGANIEWTIGRAHELDRDNDVFWPLVTLAIGSDKPQPEKLTPDQLSARLRVDYVRVYV